jgi:hypothetical protein
MAQPVVAEDCLVLRRQHTPSRAMAPTPAQLVYYLLLPDREADLQSWPMRALPNRNISRALGRRRGI